MTRVKVAQAQKNPSDNENVQEHFLFTKKEMQFLSFCLNCEEKVNIPGNGGRASAQEHAGQTGNSSTAHVLIDQEPACVVAAGAGVVVVKTG